MTETKKNSRSILVVDDEEAVRTAICDALSKEGYAVVQSPSGEDAIAKVLHEHFDVIISDVRMPGMSGFELMVVLKQMCEDSIVIMLTAVPDPESRLATIAKQAGVFAYLSKPCKLQTLKETLNTAFVHQQATHETFAATEKLSKNDSSILTKLISRATSNAISGLAGMVGRDVEVHTTKTKQIPASNVSSLLRNSENTLVGIRLNVQGDVSGTVLMIYPPDIAFGLVDILIGNPLGQTTSLDKLDESTLKEMGNVAGGFFLNSLADDTGLHLLPTPPALIKGEADRVLDNAFRPLHKVEESVFVLQTSFKTEETKITGYFLIMSSPTFLEALASHANQSLLAPA